MSEIRISWEEFVDNMIARGASEAELWAAADGFSRARSIILDRISALRVAQGFAGWPKEGD